MPSETVLVTGSNRGIGLALAREFAGHGWQVIACCRRPENAAELQQAAAEAADRIRIERLDVTDPEQVAGLAAKLRHETVDILFNNAGVAGPDRQDFGQLDEPAWVEAFRVNTVAPLRMAEAFVDQVAESRRRIIATMGSSMGSIGENREGGYYVYRTTKAAVNMIVKSLAVDLRDKGIIAVVFHPGWVLTEMGGRGAPLSPADCAVSLYRVLTTLEQEDSGKFLDYRGRERPW